MVLAIGRRGTPRKLGVPGEDLEKVAYRLIDPRQYDGKRVLVVGGGDSALEAAIQLAEETKAEVAISYRRPEFGRCRPLNKQKMDAFLKSGRITAFMSSELLSVDPETVTLKNGKDSTLPNDYVIACLGGELPNELLKTMGISIRKHMGDKAMANPALKRRKKGARSGRWAAALFFLIGALVVAGLTAVGIKYYLLPRGLRYKSPDHAMLKPSGLWGHGVGILATMFMLLNFVYPLRKRLRWFKGKGTIAPWLRFHVFVGIMSPIVILFHTAFQWGNQLATSTYVSVVVVVATGLIGRYIYGWVRLDARGGRRGPSPRQGAEGVRRGGAPGLEGSRAHGDRPLQHILDMAAGAATRPRSLPALLIRAPGEALLVWRGLRHARRLFLERAGYRAFCAQVQDLRRLRTKIAFHRRLKRLMSIWRSLHVVLAIVLLGLIGMHVWVSIRVGFRWIWK